MSVIDRVFPGFRTVRKAWNEKKPAHYRFLTSAFAPPPSIFKDLPASDVRQINQKSEEYFQRDHLREFWMNKPFSDPAWAGWSLMRFGHLLSALDLQKGDYVLDFGCGTGWTSIMLARMGLNVVAMDISSAALEIARESAERNLTEEESACLRFETYSGESISFPDHHFDAIIVFEAFHHFPNPQQILREFYRILAPNCRFGFAEPGIGHEEGEHSQVEMEEGVLERELDLEELFQSGLQAGFAGMELLAPGLHPHAMTVPMRRARWYLRGLSWLIPADYFRLTMVCTPIGLFWKGPHFVSSLHPRSHSARIRPSKLEISCGPNEENQIPVQMKNMDGTVWLKDGRYGRGYVRLGAHLLDESHQTIDQDFARCEIPYDMKETDEATVRLEFKAPATTGRYVLRLDMVNEGIGWFAEKGSPTVDIKLLVCASARPAS